MNRFALATFLLAGSARAGVIYHFTSQTVTKNGSVSVAGRVWADGDSYRLQLDPRQGRPHQYDIAISRDADRTATRFNEEKRTYEKRTRNANSRSSLLFHLPGMKSRVKGKPRIKHERLENDIVVDRSAAKHFVEIDYDLRGDVDGTQVRGYVRTEVTIWTDKELPLVGCRLWVVDCWLSVGGVAVVDRHILAPPQWGEGCGARGNSTTDHGPPTTHNQQPPPPPSPQLRQLHLVLEHIREQIADLIETLRHRPDVELQRVELPCDLTPLEWGGNRRSVDGAR